MSSQVSSIGSAEYAEETQTTIGYCFLLPFTGYQLMDKQNYLPIKEQ